MITEAQQSRLEKDFAGYAKGEPVKVEVIGAILYAFCSELASLRIFAKYNANGAHPNPKARVGYSENMHSFYFSLDIDM